MFIIQSLFFREAFFFAILSLLFPRNGFQFFWNQDVYKNFSFNFVLFQYKIGKKVQRPPLFLTGGFEGWRLHYPMHVGKNPDYEQLLNDYQEELSFDDRLSAQKTTGFIFKH